MKVIEIIAEYKLSFNDQYVLGTDGHIYRLPFEYKGRFHGLKRIKPQIRGKNNTTIGWRIAMTLDKYQLWYKAQLMPQFVKMDKPMTIKLIEPNEDFYE